MEETSADILGGLVLELCDQIDRRGADEIEGEGAEDLGSL